MGGDVCSNCAAPRRRGAQFCYRCGTRLGGAVDKEVSTPPPPTPPPATPPPATPPPAEVSLPTQGGTTITPEKWKPPEPPLPQPEMERLFEPPAIAQTPVTAPRAPAVQATPTTPPPAPTAAPPAVAQATLLPSAPASPSFVHEFGGVAVGAALGAALWIFSDPLFNWITFALPGSRFAPLVVGALFAGASLGLISSTIAGRASGVTSGVGGVVAILLGVAIQSIRFRTPVVVLITTALSWRLAVLALAGAAGAIGVTLLKPIGALARTR